MRLGFNASASGGDDRDGDAPGIDGGADSRPDSDQLDGDVDAEAAESSPDALDGDTDDDTDRPQATDGSPDGGGPVSQLGPCTGCDLSTRSCLGYTDAPDYGFTCVDQPASDETCSDIGRGDFRQCVTEAGRCDGWQFCLDENVYAPCETMPGGTQSRITRDFGDGALSCE